MLSLMRAHEPGCVPVLRERAILCAGALYGDRVVGVIGSLFWVGVWEWRRVGILGVYLGRRMGWGLTHMGMDVRKFVSDMVDYK